jgi:hypothetical protein
MVWGRRSGRHGENMPTHHFEVAAPPVDVGIRIDGDSVVVILPPELVGAYLVG